MAIEKLTEELVSRRLEEIPGWILQDGNLYRKFQFGDFVEAFAFMTRAAIYSEKVNHHPEWSNVYKTVEVSLTTHEVGGISERDFAWAATINKY